MTTSKKQYSNEFKEQARSESLPEDVLLKDLCLTMRAPAREFNPGSSSFFPSKLRLHGHEIQLLGEYIISGKTTSQDSHLRDSESPGFFCRTRIAETRTARISPFGG
jgi:hypothetical protein